MNVLLSEDYSPVKHAQVAGRERIVAMVLVLDAQIATAGASTATIR